ncbi:hypothetical protein [Gimesia maris]|nr:hypothetical protein [Gimesia maris]QDT80872.1 hypothetical protein Mal35_43470 [Gimesia maris]QDU16590.1 hypothetical protein CA11_44220 [Gimesia maris]QEG18630.1 hypothetical protein GmarT_45200 [Gimesia maris]QGQ28417.1 hypothetical protein F1729_07020 [Gimesia maris]
MKFQHSAKIGKSTTRLLMLGILTATLSIGSGTQSAEAENWTFGRSYYSHELPPEVAARYPRPESRSAYRTPELATTPGFALRGARRWNYVRLYSGNSYDTTIYRSDTFNVVAP